MKQISSDYESGLVSAIVVTYNQGQLLYDTIDSILCQNYPAIEIIVSDDCTKNFDVKAVESYIAAHASDNIVRFRVITGNTNLGTVRNENRALLLAQGEFIKLIGGDDTFSNSSVFLQQVELMQKEGTNACVGIVQQCDYTLNPIFDERVDRSNKELPAILKMEYSKSRKYIIKHDIFPISNQATCFRRSFFVKYGLCDEAYYVLDDSPLVLSVLKECPNVSFIGMTVVNHRADIGVSTSTEFFSPRRVLYYQDCVTYAKKEFVTNADIYGRLFAIESLRLSEFIYEMAVIKKKDCNTFAKTIWLIISHIDAFIYYIIKNPRKFIKRVKKRFWGKDSEGN